MSDDALSSAVVAFVGYDGGGAVPGRWPARIADPLSRRTVRELMAEVDGYADPRGADDISVWGDALVARVRERHPELSGEALAAIKALLTFEYR